MFSHIKSFFKSPTEKLEKIKRLFAYKKNHRVPDYVFDSIDSITPDNLKEMGAEAVAIDLDDTMVNNMSYSMPEKSRRWVHSLRSRNIPVIIVTNTFVFRAIYLSHKIGGVPVVPLASKPHPFPLHIASRILNIKMNKIAMIGDKYSKDVLAANRAGAISIKVNRAPLNIQ